MRLLLPSLIGVVVVLPLQASIDLWSWIAALSWITTFVPDWIFWFLLATTVLGVFRVGYRFIQGQSSLVILTIALGLFFILLSGFLRRAPNAWTAYVLFFGVAMWEGARLGEGRRQTSRLLDDRQSARRVGDDAKVAALLDGRKKRRSGARFSRKGQPLGRAADHRGVLWRWRRCAACAGLTGSWREPEDWRRSSSVSWPWNACGSAVERFLWGRYDIRCGAPGSRCGLFAVTTGTSRRRRESFNSTIPGCGGRRVETCNWSCRSAS